MDNVSIFQQLEEQVVKTEHQVEELDRAVEHFIGLNGSGDGVRKLLRAKIRNNKQLQQVCKQSKKKKR